MHCCFFFFFLKIESCFIHAFCSRFLLAKTFMRQTACTLGKSVRLGWDGWLPLRCNAVQCNQCQMHTLCDSLSHLRSICQQVTSLQSQIKHKTGHTLYSKEVEKAHLNCPECHRIFWYFYSDSGNFVTLKVFTVGVSSAWIFQEMHSCKVGGRLIPDIWQSCVLSGNVWR